MKRILIADDDEAICSLIASMLEGAYETCCAVGLEATQCALGQNRFDLIIADYFLGTPDPYPSVWPLGEVCRRLAPRTPIIALTGLDPSLRSLTRSSGARAIMPKPFDMQDLLTTVGQTLA